MPELPEVEVTLRGIAPVLKNSVIKSFVLRCEKLRTEISPAFKTLKDLKVLSYARRGKYIVITTSSGFILLHLGMTGHLAVWAPNKAPNPGRHDHIDILLDSGYLIRFNDQRRFGLFEWYPKPQDVYECKWLKVLGPEPLTDKFTGGILKQSLARRKSPIKEVLMNSHVLVGVGNIYASEVLFRTKINPLTPACNISLDDCERLVVAIKDILTASIACGGTTIRDFSGADGKLSYFVGNLQVYGHAGEACPLCGTKIEQKTLGGRSTFFCPHCQR